MTDIAWKKLKSPWDTTEFGDYKNDFRSLRNKTKKPKKTSVHMFFVDFFLSEMICWSQDTFFSKLIKKCSRISPACCERNNFMAECELAEIKLLWFPTDREKWIFRMKSFSPQARCFLTNHIAANSPRPFLTTLNHLTMLWRLEKNIFGANVQEVRTLVNNLSRLLCQYICQSSEIWGVVQRFNVCAFFPITNGFCYNQPEGLTLTA